MTLAEQRRKYWRLLFCTRVFLVADAAMACWNAASHAVFFTALALSAVVASGISLSVWLPNLDYWIRKRESLHEHRQADSDRNGDSQANSGTWTVTTVAGQGPGAAASSASVGTTCTVTGVATGANFGAPGVYVYTSSWPYAPPLEPSPPPAIDESELIVGWRAWRLVPVVRLGLYKPAPWLNTFFGDRAYRLDPDGFVLQSVYMPSLWFPGITAEAFSAELGVDWDETKNSCGRGIYSMNDREVALRYCDSFETAYHPNATLLVVFGEVYQWGSYVQHSLGVRSQYAYPKRLWVDSRVEEMCGDVVGKLRRSYGIDVEWQANRDAS